MCVCVCADMRACVVLAGLSHSCLSLVNVKSQLRFVYCSAKCLHLCKETAWQRCSTPTLIHLNVICYYDISRSNASSAVIVVYLLRLWRFVGVRNDYANTLD